MSTSIEDRAIALLKRLVEHRKDDAQGLSVRIVDKEEEVEVTITAKPSAGGFKRFGQQETQSKTALEMVQELKAMGFQEEEIKIEAQGDMAKITLPYKAELNNTLRDAGYKWNFNDKIREHPLKASPQSAQAPPVQKQIAPTPVQREAAKAPVRVDIPAEAVTVKAGLDGKAVSYRIGDNEINSYFEGVGMLDDMQYFNISVVEGKIHVSPKKFLGDLWGGFNEVFKTNGGVWVKDGKASRWEISWG